MKITKVLFLTTALLLIFNVSLAADVKLAWDLNTESDIAQYTITRAPKVIDGSGDFTVLATVDHPVSTYTDQDISDPYAWVYQIYAVDTFGQRSYGSRVNWDIKEIPPPPSPPSGAQAAIQ